MLVLTRKLEEVVLIGESVRVKVLSIENGQVKLGIDAPSATKIYRAEIYNEIQNENKRAVQADKKTVATAARLIKVADAKR